MGCFALASSSMAQQALMNAETFRDFYFRVCTMDYSRMILGMKALKKRMDKADQIHISGDETDLCFSIKGIGAVSCGGTHNIPDGEVFSCPVRDSVEGTIHFNAPTVYQGTSFDNIRLTFKKGKIIDATGSNTVRLNEILDQDEGARYIGEFAIAFNPHILHPMRDILFDEKISGSFHFTPGQAYEEADNGNRSQVHWDMVSIQRPDYGGGSMFFDGELIRQDGLFVPEDLHPLNPEYLLGRTNFILIHLAVWNLGAIPSGSKYLTKYQVGQIRFCPTGIRRQSNSYSTIFRCWARLA